MIREAATLRYCFRPEQAGRRMNERGGKTPAKDD
jgi:hypothetical protein